jgi:hypothetical protein
VFDWVFSADAPAKDDVDDVSTASGSLKLEKHFIFFFVFLFLP